MKIVASKGKDAIEIEVLDDGSLKMSTGSISMANHGGAEALVSEVIKSFGGDAERRRKSPHAHSHNHNHSHSDHSH